MASVSSESCTLSSKASSQRKTTRGRGAYGGVTRAEDLFFDIDANFSGDEVLLDLGAQRHSLRPRFPPQ